MRSFRDIYSSAEILDLLKLAPFEGRGKIWQSEGAVRKIYEIGKIDNNPGSRAIVFKFLKPIKFSSAHPVYVWTKYRDLIFKIPPSEFTLGLDSLSCSYPLMAKALEERERERIGVPPGKEVLITLKPLGKSSLEIKVKLRDISRSGIGVFVSEVNKFFLTKNERFKIVEINGLVFPVDGEVHLRHTKKVKAGFHAGLELQRELSPTIYNIFMNVIIED